MFLKHPISIYNSLTKSLLRLNSSKIITLVTIFEMYKLLSPFVEKELTQQGCSSLASGNLHFESIPPIL